MNQPAVLSVRRAIDLAKNGPYFAGFLLLALVAFWPTYLSVAPGTSSAYTHLHAVTATMWMVLLIVQPLAIRAKRLALHRTVGQVSYVVAAGVLGTILLLAHSRLQQLAPVPYAIQAPVPTWNYQWFTFGLTDAVFLVLIWLERHNRTGRTVFPVMLSAFVLAQLPALLRLTESGAWQAFAAWFAGLPLT